MNANARAQLIAQLIREKKLKEKEPKEETEALFLDDTGDGLDDELPLDELEVPVDPKEARKERLKAILAR